MSDGGAESTRENESELVSSRGGGGNDFGRQVAKVAVSQICEGVGFHGVKESALDSFTELAIRFLCELGKSSSFSANLAGRRECSVFDVIRGLENLGFGDCEGAYGVCEVGGGNGNSIRAASATFPCHEKSGNGSEFCANGRNPVIKLSDELTGKGHVSVVEAFAPAIEAVEGGVSDDGDGQKKFVPNKIRARVTKTARKPVGVSLDLNQKNKGKRPVTWIARDDERDEKKRRAEYILRQSMENTQDLLQL